MSTSEKILVVDDEASLRSLLAEILIQEGYLTRAVPDARIALEMIGTGEYSVVFSDIRMPGMNGLELLKEIKRHDPMIEVVIITSHASLETAVEALRAGAYDYLVKPFDDISIVASCVRRLIQKVRLEKENRCLIETLKMKNQRLEEANQMIHQLHEDTVALFHLGKELTISLETEDVLERTVRAVSSLMGDRPCLLLTHSEKRSELVLEKTCGFSLDRLPDLRVRLQDINPGRSFSPAMIQEALKIVPMECPLVMPITMHGCLKGVLAVFDPAKKGFTPREENLLHQYIGQVAVAWDNAMLHHKVQEMATRDGLTGLHNYRYFQDYLSQTIGHTKQNGQPLSLILMDVDHFKDYNDHYGHIVGDEVLKQVAGILMTRIPPTNLIARYGGDEFIVIASQTPKGQALLLSEKIAHAIEQHPFSFQDQRLETQMTVSIGIAELPEDAVDGRGLIQKADQALYRAKREGRHRVCMQP